MKKNINYLIWLVFIICYPAFGFIIEQLSTTYKENYNATGTIICRNYSFNLNIEPNIIKTYEHIENINLATTDACAYENKNLLFALIPRKYGNTENICHNDVSAKQILSMNKYLNSNYPSQISDHSEIIQDLYFTTKKQLFLTSFYQYLLEQNLNNDLSKQKIEEISQAIIGSYGLFMPENIEMLAKFNGSDHILSSAVSIIDDILLKAEDFTNNDKNITKEQFINLQLLIFKAMEQAKTVIFIPEYTTKIKNNEIRLPVALINNVSLDSNTGNITLNLIFGKNTTTKFFGYRNFVSTINALLEIDNENIRFEFIDYSLKIDDTNSDAFDPYCSNASSLQYKFLSSQASTNVNTQYQKTYQQIINYNIADIGVNENDLSAECRAPNTSELQPINNIQENNLATTIFLDDLLNVYNYNDELINEKLYQLRYSTYSSDFSIKQQEIIQNILKYNNDHFISSCKHYNRKCFVMFDCMCDYWDCHKLHNEISEGVAATCKLGNKVESINIKRLKCKICNYKQDFNAETSHSCKRCNTKFSDYYCGKCKHFTDKENNPYHCDKCGLCRTNKESAYHCDVCSLCMHIKLKNNHKCRPDSVHDKCSVCSKKTFRDASIILHCGHRIHERCVVMLSKNRNECSICIDTHMHNAKSTRNYKKK